MDKKKRLWLFVLIVILAVVVLAYIGYDKVSPSSSPPFTEEEEKLAIDKINKLVENGELSREEADKITKRIEEGTITSKSGSETAMFLWSGGKGDNGDGCAVNTDCESGFCNVCGKCQGLIPTGESKRGCSANIDCAGFDCTSPTIQDSSIVCCYMGFNAGHMCVPNEFCGVSQMNFVD
jgi:hypothetical protein